MIDDFKWICSKCTVIGLEILEIKHQIVFNNYLDIADIFLGCRWFMSTNLSGTHAVITCLGDYELNDGNPGVPMKEQYGFWTLSIYLW